jgi:3-dehydroquinate synthase
METLRVALGSRAYPIHIGSGLLDDARLYAPHVGGRHVAVVSNAVVAPLYLERVTRALAAAGARTTLQVVVEDGEQAKSWQALERVFDQLLAARFGRDGMVVALGGGVIGDLAGFAAAVYQRGVPFLQVPTTLLAQVDSSVGGKTAINHARGKNMVGAFHQPRAVISDVATLDTLPERELRAGIAEVVKHGFILDAAFIGWLEANMGKLVARERAALEYAVRRCCELKAGVVAADERESGLRAILNFGHTFGHAIEAGLGYGEWLHGEAVAAGMVMAAELSVRAAGLARSDAERVRALVARAGLPATAPALSPERLLELMQVDKKAAAGRLRFVLLHAIGAATVRGDLDDALVRAAISACAPGAARAAAAQ